MTNKISLTKPFTALLVSDPIIFYVQLHVTLLIQPAILNQSLILCYFDLF